MSGQFDRRTDKTILNILHSGKVNYWTGPIGMAFEQAFATWLGVKHAVSVMNGAAARRVAFLALGLDPDEGKGALLVRHAHGEVADLAVAKREAKRRGIPLIEDCSQCLGGVWRGHKTGTVGLVSFFSFDADDAFTTGGAGGMVCTNDDDLAWEMRSIRDQGYDVRAKIDLQKATGRQIYVHRRLGYNLRLTEIQSAIGLGELKRFDTWNLPHRRALGRALVKALKGNPQITRAPLDTPSRQNAFPYVRFELKGGDALVIPTHPWLAKPRLTRLLRASGLL